jgi:hypothetical protein
MDLHAAKPAVIRMMGEPKLQPPQTVEPVNVLAWVHAELVIQPLSMGLEMVRAG